MCGIAGYLAKRPHSFKLAEAVGCLHHRGPDQQGIWERDGAGLGHARLSIIDLSDAGRQPMASPDGRYVLAFNGEIYNFQELRRDLEAAGETFVGHSDTEVLLRLYQREGEKCLEKLRGMFAFAVWDLAERTLFLARDRLGVKPLVYAESDAGFLFASEIPALFALQPDLPRTPDYSALDHYLTFQYIPAPLTGFAALKKLPPAHAMTVRDGRIQRLWRYWDIDHSQRSDLSFDDACEALREKFLEATKLRLVSDVPLGAFLSGGIDSSITVAAMAHLGVEKIKTFAIGFEDQKFNELPYARQIAEHLSTDHHEMVVRPDAVAILPQLVRHFGEPMADNSAIPTYYVSQFARSEVTVALTGDGGDEVFAGYRRFYHATLTDRLERRRLLPLWRGLRRLTWNLEGRMRPGKKRPPFPASRADEILSMKGVERYQHLLAYYPEAEKEELLTPAFREQSGQAASGYLAAHLARAVGADPLNRYLHLDLSTYLPEDILFKVDIASMLNSLECRSPFLDHRLIEFVFSLPGSYKLKFPHRHKHLLKEAFKDWLPPGFMDRGKMGFSAPMPGWLRHELAPMMRERLLEEKRLAPWINQSVVERLVREHVSGEKMHSKRLWPLLVMAEWVEQYEVTE